MTRAERRLLRLGRWLTILAYTNGLACNALVCLVAVATATDQLKNHLC